MGIPPVLIHFGRSFHYKSYIWGYPYYRKPPYEWENGQVLMVQVVWSEVVLSDDGYTVLLCRFLTCIDAHISICMNLYIHMYIYILYT